MRSSVAPGSALEQHEGAGRRVLERVVEEVRKHALDLGGVDLDRRSLGADLQPDPSGLRAETRERLADELVHMPELAMRLGRPGFKAREVEELLDEPIKTRRLALDRLGEPEPVLRLQHQPGTRERVGRGEDRGERRAQVVGDRPQERRLQRVAAAQRLGLEHPFGKPFPLLGQFAQRRNAASASSARRRERVASSLTTTAVTTKTSERKPVLGVRDRERVERQTKKKLKASTLPIATPTA